MIIKLTLPTKILLIFLSSIFPLKGPILKSQCYAKSDHYVRHVNGPFNKGSLSSQFFENTACHTGIK
jgi:hypothetical protein